MDVPRRQAIAVLALALAAATPVAAGAQGSGTERIVPTNRVLITGYGTVGYGYITQEDHANAFNTSLNPILLFQFQDRVLFEAELEFELEDGITSTGLEYAQLSYMANDNLVLSAGKFLLPFGVFGPRLHASWINRFATAPPIYGHGAASGVAPLVPVLRDVGVMARTTVDLGNANLSFNGYITQGPSVESEAAGHDEQAGEEDGVPELQLPASSSDNNTNKMFGGRIDLAFSPRAEFNVSAFTGTYDHENVLDFTGYNVAGEFRDAGFEVRGEYMQTRQQIETDDGFPVFVRHGLYLQSSYRHGAFEPVFRWTQILDDELDGVVTDKGASQAGLGLDYWLSPSIAVMTGYEINRERGPEIANDRLVLHVSFGF